MHESATFLESSFRENLVATEAEMVVLRNTVDELKQQGKAKDKACSEIKRLKGIITAQDEKVRSPVLCAPH